MRFFTKSPKPDPAAGPGTSTGMGMVGAVGSAVASPALGSAYAPPGFPPPPGPPPSQHHPAPFAPHLGAPPAYAPPEGPPPSHSQSYPQQQQPSQQKQPQHDWQSAVPDTTLFPPPPPFFASWESSPTNNATEEEAIAGERWCSTHLLSSPRQHPPPTSIMLLPPNGFNGTITSVQENVHKVQVRGARDHTILSYPPLYSALNSPQPKTPDPSRRPLYYEVKIHRQGTSPEVGLALGVVALPYPPFRLPGWHRGSLAVHGDDGHRYVNDIKGGVEFTEPFIRGGTYGIGIRNMGARDGEEVIFTREGEIVGAWPLREEMDSESGMGIWGLEGVHDLCAAVGAFGDVSYDVIFDRQKWLYSGMT